MENYFSSYYQKCKKEECCNSYQFFKIPLANHNDSGKCLLGEAQKILYSLHSPLCKRITFLDFNPISPGMR